MATKFHFSHSPTARQELPTFSVVQIQKSYRRILIGLTYDKWLPLTDMAKRGGSHNTTSLLGAHPHGAELFLQKGNHCKLGSDLN